MGRAVLSEDIGFMTRRLERRRVAGISSGIPPLM
jgi:hypothetical protein